MKGVTQFLFFFPNKKFFSLCLGFSEDFFFLLEREYLVVVLSIETKKFNKMVPKPYGFVALQNRMAI